MLRDYQIKLDADIRDAIRSGARRVLAVSPTGSGKTEVFTHITQGATAKGNKPFILVHRRRLVEQINARLAKYGTSADVATVQSKPDAKRYKLIIIDEAHRSAAGGYQDIIWGNPSATVLGFTATPRLTDGRGLGDIYQAMVLGPSYKQLMDAGWLAKPVYYAPSKVDLTGVRKTGGDYNIGDLDAAVQRARITGSAIEHYKRLAMGKKGLGFCVSIASSEKAAQDFNDAGIAAGVVHGKMKQRDIDTVFARLESGELLVVFSCDLVSEGYDCPAVECIINLRPTHSLIVNDQQIGRGSRLAQGKDSFIILDHVGNVSKHGMITEDREWSLDGKKKRVKDGGAEAIERTKECPHCFHCHDPAVCCPKCGFIYPVVQKKLKEVEGELELYEEVKRIQKRNEERGYKTLDDWLAIAKARGYNPGWAYYRHRARSNRWN